MDTPSISSEVLLFDILGTMRAVTDGRQTRRSRRMEGRCGAPHAMRIQSSEINLTAQHSQLKEHSIRQTLRLRVTAQPSPAARADRPALLGGAGDTVQVSDSARARLVAAGEAPKAGRTARTAGAAAEQAKMRLLIAIIERLTGRKIKVVSMEDLSGKADGTEQAAADRSAPPTQPTQPQISLFYERVEETRESEQVDFHARGIVETEDGRRLEFEVSLKLNREFVSRLTLRIGGGPQPEDPLVINYAAPTAVLGAPGGAVDLNGDGRAAELLPQLMPGSGYLVRDVDGDGRITRGDELFGPHTGNGFAELAAHDADRSGWLDAADPIYSELRLWAGAVDAEGNAAGLLTLAECGVGAIWLRPIETPFELRDASQSLLGQLRATGVFVGPDGRAGTVQQIDLVVGAQE